MLRVTQKRSLIGRPQNQRQSVKALGLRRIGHTVDVVDNAYAACDGVSAIVVATEWDEFTSLDLDRVGDLVAERNLIDARNLLDQVALRQRGFTYQGVGRS